MAEGGGNSRVSCSYSVQSQEQGVKAKPLVSMSKTICMCLVFDEICSIYFRVLVSCAVPVGVEYIWL